MKARPTLGRGLYVWFLPPLIVLTFSIGVMLHAAEPSQTPQRQVSFRRTFGGTGMDEGNFVQQTIDGGYIAIGVTTSFGEGAWNTWLVKVDAQGSEQWNRSFGAGHYECGEALQVTADGGYIIVGATLSAEPQDYDLRLIKTNGNGRQLWTRTYGGTSWDWGHSVRQTADEGFIITGWTDSRGAGGGDLWLIKTDARGEELWTRTYGGPENDCGNWVQPTGDGGYIVTGATSSASVGNDDLWLIKTTATGDPQWMRTFGGAGYDEGHYVQVTSDGGYIVVGSTTSGSDRGSDVWLIKLQSTGRTIWTRTYGGEEWEWGNAVSETPDGGFIIVGTTLSYGAGASDLWLIKTDDEGNEEWSRTYGGHDLDFGLSVEPTGDGGFILAGRTFSYGAGNSDMWLIKTDSEGQAIF